MIKEKAIVIFSDRGLKNEHMLRRVSNKSIWLLVLAIFGCWSGVNTIQAQDRKILSLEEATQLALKHDWQSKIDDASISSLEAKVTQSKTANGPDVDLNLNYTRLSDNITPFTIALPPGQIVLNPQILNQSYNSLQLKQLILAGGKVHYGLQISKKEVEAARWDAAKNKINTTYNIAALWYNLYVLKTSKKIIEANIENLLQSQKDISNFVAQGILLENESTKIDLAVTNLQSNLIDISNGISALNFNICLFTGLPAGTIIDLPDLAEQDLNQAPTLETYISEAIANRPELKKIQAYKDIAYLGLKISKGNYTPVLAGIASVNYNRPEQRVFPNEAKFTNTWYVGVNFDWTISSFYKNPAKVKENKLALTKIDATGEQIREGIMLEVNTAYTEYLQASQKLVIEKKAILEATENYRVEQNKLNASIITTTDFLEANTKLLQAKLNYNAAFANAQLALKKLNKTIGK